MKMILTLLLFCCAAPLQAQHNHDHDGKKEKGYSYQKPGARIGLTSAKHIVLAEGETRPLTVRFSAVDPDQNVTVLLVRHQDVYIEQSERSWTFTNGEPISIALTVTSHSKDISQIVFEIQVSENNLTEDAAQTRVLGVAVIPNKVMIGQAQQQSKPIHGERIKVQKVSETH